MDIAQLEQLVQLMRDSTVGELTLRHDGERVTIRKAARSGAPVVDVLENDDEYSYSTQYAEVMDDEADQATEEREGVVLVTSPLVGVFAHVKPLVGLNSRVTEGQVVGVIEAMKITTEINAPASGTIVEIFIEAGHPVEFGQALFEIRVE